MLGRCTRAVVEHLDAAFVRIWTPNEPEQVLEKQLRGIQRSTQRANQLIEDLLDVTRIEAGRLSIEPSTHDAGALLAEAHEMLRLSADEKAIRTGSQTESRWSRRTMTASPRCCAT